MLTKRPKIFRKRLFGGKYNKGQYPANYRASLQIENNNINSNNTPNILETCNKEYTNNKNILIGGSQPLSDDNDSDYEDENSEKKSSNDSDSDYDNNENQDSDYSESNSVSHLRAYIPMNDSNLVTSSPQSESELNDKLKSLILEHGGEIDTDYDNSEIMNSIQSEENSDEEYEENSKQEDSDEDSQEDSDEEPQEDSDEEYEEDSVYSDRTQRGLFGEVIPTGTKWVPYYDDDAEAHYYYNVDTGDTTWDNPDDEEYEEDSDENDELEEDVSQRGFAVGDAVKVLYSKGKWYNAIIDNVESDGSYHVQWTDPRVYDIIGEELGDENTAVFNYVDASEVRRAAQKDENDDSDENDENNDSDDDDDSDNNDDDDDDGNEVKAVAEQIFNLTRQARGATISDVDEPKVRKSKRIEYIKSGLKQKEDEERRKYNEDVKKFFREVGDSYMKSLMDENSDEEEEGVPEMKESEPELRRSDRLKGLKPYIPSYIKSESDDNVESDSTVEEPISDSEDDVKDSKSKAVREERRKIQERVARRVALSNTAASLRPVVASALKKDKSSTPVPRRRSSRIAAQEEKKSEAKEDDLGEMFQPRRRSLRIAEQSSTRDEQKDSLETIRNIYESSNVRPRLRRSRRNTRRTTGGADDETPIQSENDITEAATTLSSIGDVEIIRYWTEQAELAKRRGELGPYINAQDEVERAVDRARPRRQSVHDYEDMFEHMRNLSLNVTERNRNDDVSVQDSQNSNMEESKDESKDSYMDESKDSFEDIDVSRPNHPHPFVSFNTPPLDNEPTPTSGEIETNRRREHRYRLNRTRPLISDGPTEEEKDLWENLQRPAMVSRTQTRLGSIDMDDFMENESVPPGAWYLFSPRGER